MSRTDCPRRTPVNQGSSGRSPEFGGSPWHRGVRNGGEAGEAAEQAGLQRGDVIVSVNGSPVAGVDEFEQAIEAARKEGVARLRVRNSGGFRFVVLKVS